MNRLFDSLGVALSALHSNPLRATLTTGGIVVGIFFVLVMGWVLDGLDRAFTDSFAFFGDDIVYVDRFDWSGKVSWQDQRNRPEISMRHFRELKRNLEIAEWLVPTVSRTVRRLEANNFVQQGVSVFGTTHEYIDMYSASLNEGRFFSEMEERTAAHVVVLGWNVAENLFPQGGALGRSVKIDRRSYQIIGVMPKRGTVLIDFIDDIVLIPITRYSARYGSESLTINARAPSVEDLDDMKDELIGAMRAVRSLGPYDDLDFGVNTQEMFTEFIDVTRTIVWGIGLFLTGLAFLVGSIGIMNIMFVSVTERIREIGIRKSVGGTRSAILLQFLIEAVMLSLVGAAIALVLASLIVLFKDDVVRGVLSIMSLFDLADASTSVDLSFLPSTIPMAQVAVAVLAATFVGLGAGIIPAFRASRLSPVDALRST